MLEWLKMILGDAYTADIDTKVSAEIGKGFVAKADFNAKNEELKTANATIKERDTQLETLKTSTGDVEALKKQITDLQTENKTKDDTHKAELHKLRVDQAVEKALTNAKAKNITAVKALLSPDLFEKGEIADDGTLKGLDDAIKKLTESDDTKFLFDIGKSKTTFKGFKPDEKKDEPPTGLSSKEEFLKLSSKDQMAFIAENPNWKELLGE